VDSTIKVTAREIGFIAPSGIGHEWQRARHRPERTLPNQLVERRYFAFVEQLARRGHALQGNFRREFEAYL
jgi:hypothetical protein